MVHPSEYEKCFKSLMDVIDDNARMYIKRLEAFREMQERVCCLEQSYKERIGRLEHEIKRHRYLLDIAETRQRLSEIPFNPRPGTEG